MKGLEIKTVYKVKGKEFNDKQSALEYLMDNVGFYTLNCRTYKFEKTLDAEEITVVDCTSKKNINLFVGLCEEQDCPTDGITKHSELGWYGYDTYRCVFVRFDTQEGAFNFVKEWHKGH